MASPVASTRPARALLAGPLCAGSLLWVALTVAGCEPIESRGAIFAPARSSSPAAAAPVDSAFAFPTEPPLTLSSEELAQGDATTGLATAVGVDVDALPGSAPSLSPTLPASAGGTAAPVASSGPPAFGVPDAIRWPVRLVSTLPQAQPPRAILGLPSGEERVVSPGSMLAAEGLVVVSITADRVQLARIEPAGDHANITSFELTAQYAARP